MAIARRRENTQGELLYSIYRNNDNELLVYHHFEALRASTDKLVLLPTQQVLNDMKGEKKKAIEAKR